MDYHLHEVVIEITKTCNLRCLHCGSACENKADQRELTLDEWKLVLRDLKDFGVRKVVFSGGEPTIRESFAEIVAFCDKIDLHFGLISNGYAIPTEVMKALKKHKPFAVGISIDGMRRAHNTIRKNNHSWGNTFQSISQLQEFDIPICISTTLSRLNYSDLRHLATLLSLMDIDAWQIQLAMPSGRMCDRQNLLVDEEIFKQICRDIVYIRKRYLNIHAAAADCFGLAPKYSIRPGDFNGCGAGRQMIGIDAFGNVLPCLSMRDAVLCGNLLEESIESIWQSDCFDFNRCFNMIDLGENCRECEHGAWCRGGCNSQSFAYFKESHNSPFCYERSFNTGCVKQNKEEV